MHLVLYKIAYKGPATLKTEVPHMFFFASLVMQPRIEGSYLK